MMADRVMKNLLLKFEKNSEMDSFGKNKAFCCTIR